MGRKKKVISEPQKKARKVTSGPLRDKSRTMARMVAAVGKVLQKNGHGALNILNVATAAGVDPKLISLYFGGIDNLIEEYIVQKEFWRLGTSTPGSRHTIDQILGSPDTVGRKETIKLLQDHFETFNKNIPLQKVIAWEMTEKSKLLRKIADQREELGENLLHLIDPYFEDSSVDVRATIALLIGGIYYLNLHARQNGSKVCGLDINMLEDKERIIKALEDNINRVFDAVPTDK